MHVAPIGPHVDRELQSWSVKPFQTSTTFQNLIRTNRAIFHVTDDALLMAASVLGIGNTPSPEVLPPTRQQHWSDRIQQRRASKWVHEKGWVLEQACRAFALRAERWDVSAPRPCRLFRGAFLGTAPFGDGIGRSIASSNWRSWSVADSGCPRTNGNRNATVIASSSIRQAGRKSMRRWSCCKRRCRHNGHRAI